MTCEFLYPRGILSEHEADLKMSKQNIKIFRCLVIGDSGTGKTTFVNRHVTGKFNEFHKPTFVWEAHPITFHTNRGVIHFMVRDMGKLKKKYLETFFKLGQCAIIMAEFESPTANRSVPETLSSLQNFCGNIPVVLCGNKADLKSRAMADKMSLFQGQQNSAYYEMSVKGEYNVEKPFLWLASKLLGDANLKFGSPPAVQPPDSVLDKKLMLKEAHEIDSPEDDVDLIETKM